MKWFLAIVIAFSCMASALAVDLTPEQQERAQNLFRQVRCPVCEAQPISESDASLSYAMRDVISQAIAEGQTDTQILASLTQTYGDDIRLLPKTEPRTLPLWLAPWLVIGFGIIGIVITRQLKNRRNA